MRVPYLLACWLVLGCLLVSDEVHDLYLYEYVVGAEVGQWTSGSFETAPRVP